jgi:hypothetical protein
VARRAAAHHGRKDGFDEPVSIVADQVLAVYRDEVINDNLRHSGA